MQTGKHMGKILLKADSHTRVKVCLLGLFIVGTLSFLF